jgi:leader peptidase (prepilin peptidase)/N-methyltransferase
VTVFTGPMPSACIAVAMALSVGQETVRVAHQNVVLPGFGRERHVGAAATAIAGTLAIALICSCTATELLIAAPLVVFALPAVVVDAHEQRLPDALTWPLATATSMVVAAASAVEPAAGLRAAAAAGAVAAAAVFLKVIRSDVIGWGDVKLVPSLAAVLGWADWDVLLSGVALWVVFIAVQAAVVSILGRGGSVPYGPALLAGVVGALLAA